MFSASLAKVRIEPPILKWFKKGKWIVQAGKALKNSRSGLLNLRTCFSLSLRHDCLTITVTITIIATVSSDELNITIPNYLVFTLRF